MGLPMAELDRSGRSRPGVGAAVALRLGNGLAPLGRVGRFVRKSVRKSAVHFLCESSGLDGTLSEKDWEFFKGDGRKEVRVAKGC